jgi:hypothetical protein
MQRCTGGRGPPLNVRDDYFFSNQDWIMLKNPGTLLIIVLIVAIAFAIGAYQLVINKYYWGPKGPPEEDQQKKKRNKS